MVSALEPSTFEELAEALRSASSRSHTVQLYGSNSKCRMAGPVEPAEVAISTVRLNRVLQYEPSDLSIGIEAGAKWADIQGLLAERGQMIALDPPPAENATVGGVVAANVSGPMRRLYGTARDLVIGMSFVTLEGKLITSGGMVVKNVAGLDMAKMMIGSFGTLAAIARVNFRLHPKPEQTQTFLYSFPTVESAIQKRDAILNSPLQPLACDLRFDGRSYTLAIRAGGSERVLARYRRELNDAEVVDGAVDWPHPGEIVLRVSTPLTALSALFRLISSQAVSRAANGVTYVSLASYADAAPILRACAANQWIAAFESAPDEARQTNDLWFEQNPSGFDMMKRVKQMFDPEHLLNRRRMYGRF